MELDTGPGHEVGHRGRSEQPARVGQGDKPRGDTDSNAGDVAADQLALARAQ